MGDKTRLNMTGHLPQFYDIGLRFIEELVRAYKESGIEHKLRLISISQPGGASAPTRGTNRPSSFSPLDPF
jgi:predicted nucleotidyltransferase